MSLFVDYLRSTALYQELCGLTESPHGNLLERTGDDTAEAQTEFLRWALCLAQPATVIETGTNKGLFGCFLSLAFRAVSLHTFDIWPESAKAVDVLNRHRQWVTFHLGDSRQTLAAFDGPADFAWIDGDHDGDGPASDLAQCLRLRVPFVALDDVDLPGVQEAIDKLLCQRGCYVVGNPFRHADRRRAILLKINGGRATCQQ